MEFVKDNQFGIPVPFPGLNDTPVGRGIVIQISVGVCQLSGQDRLPHLPWSGKEHYFFLQVFADEFFQISFHATIMNKTSEKSRLF